MKLPIAKFPATLQEIKLNSLKSLGRLSHKLQSELKKKSATLLNAQINAQINAQSDSLTNFQKAGTAKASAKKASPFQAAPSKSSVRASKGSKLFLNLLLVRPWVLVLGFWLLSMGVGTLALDGILSPRRLTKALPEAAAETSTSETSTSSGRGSQLNVEQAAGEDAGGDVETSATEANPTSEGSSDSSIPLLPIAALVGSCAAGSLCISRRRVMVRMAAARAQGRVRKSRPASTVTHSVAHSVAHSVPQSAARSNQPLSKQLVKNASAKVNTKASVKANVKASTKGKSSVGEFAGRSGSDKAAPIVRSLRPKKRRQRSKRSLIAQSSGNRVAGKDRVLVSRATAQKSAPAARPQSRVSRFQARHVASRAAGRQQPIVSVVPANESNALDWQNGSLAHQLDVRSQQRSAM